MTPSMVHDNLGNPVTEFVWERVDHCIKSFIKTYPKHWKAFVKDLADNQTEYQEALTPDGKKAQWRNTAAFPVVYRKATPEDGLTGEEDDDLVEVASLIKPLTVFLPGLTDPDTKGKPNKLYREFLRRYPVFRPGRKG